MKIIKIVAGRLWVAAWVAMAVSGGAGAAEINDEAASFEADSAAMTELLDAGDFAKALETLANMQRSYPKRAGEIAGMSASAKDLRRQSLDFDYAVRQLGGEDQMAANVAAAKLAEGGDAAWMVLRRAVREQEEPIAARAATLLANGNDAKGAPVILRRFLSGPASPIRPQLLSCLTRLTSVMPAAFYAPVYESFKTEPETRKKDVVPLLGTVFQGPGRSDKAEFDKAMGDAGAYDNIRTFVQAALSGTNGASARAWADQAAVQFGAFMTGFRGSYFEGVNFDKLVFERLDAQIEVQDRKFTYPDGRQDNISVRWTGKVVIGEKGKYTFKVSSDDGNRLWIDGKKQFDQWGGPVTQEASVELEPGLHDLQIEFQQGIGGAWIRVTWSGPGFSERLLTKDHVSVVPWEAIPQAGK